MIERERTAPTFFARHRVVVNYYYLRPVKDYQSHLRYQGELWGIWDPQNRDPRRKLLPETEFSVGLLSPPLRAGGVK